MQNKNKLLLNKMSSPRNVVGDLRLTWLYYKKEFSLFHTAKSAEDSRQGHSGMTALFHGTAFTLIELLVVVLIIGILAAVAIPQYEKAVEKAKATQALTLLKSAYQAAATYYMANGTYPETFEEMGFEVPWTGTEKWTSLPNVKETRSNKDWSLQLYRVQDGGFSIYVGRISGKYAGAGFVMSIVNSSGELRPGKIICAERKSDGIVFDTNLSDGDYCVKIMNGTLNNDLGAVTRRDYTLP